MRKLAAAILAVPVIAVVYVPVLLRRSIASRVGLAIGVGGLIGLGALGAIAPVQTLATPRQDPIVPLESAAFTTSIAANTSVRAPITLAFSAPMDPTSVAGSLQVEPNVPVNLSWDATTTHLTVTPKTNWAPATYHTISVLAGALGASGRPMIVPARAAFLTRAATTATVTATSRTGDAARVDTALRLTFDAKVAVDDLRRGLRISPTVDGTLQSVQAADGASAYLFTPAVPLVAGSVYTLGLDGVVDADGAAVTLPGVVTIRTVGAPGVVRFRPVDGTKAVAQTAVLSVRFSQPMTHKTTSRSPARSSSPSTTRSSSSRRQRSCPTAARSRSLSPRAPRRRAAPPCRRSPARRSPSRRSPRRRSPCPSHARRLLRAGRPAGARAAPSVAAAGARSRPTTCA